MDLCWCHAVVKAVLSHFRCSWSSRTKANWLKKSRLPEFSIVRTALRPYGPGKTSKACDLNHMSEEYPVLLHRKCDRTYSSMFMRTGAKWRCLQCTIRSIIGYSGWNDENRRQNDCFSCFNGNTNDIPFSKG